MLVRERMSHPVITIHPEMPVQEALKRMREEHIRRFPVVDQHGKLIGIVSERDLLHAAPSDATSLSIWEINYLLSRITVDKVMTREVITVSEDTPLEDAAGIMADNKIGGLPVIQNGKVIGIITETDLFKIFLEMLGARETGVRLTILIPVYHGELAKLTKAIYEIGGTILALSTFLGENCENREVTIKVDGIEQQTLINAVQPYVEGVLDIRGSPFTPKKQELPGPAYLLQGTIHT
jgi:acetoin utilization protein AcuB